ncbi:MAG TPA: glycosyltransferase family 4 protein [Mesorhizobium sp.]|jgi:glycosyltransferase involved in cell wall biosynthesis|nr:glycosyltransferase family 4 protein [Mesorhizobium sp.]
MPEALRIVHCFRSPVGGIFRHVRDLAEAQAAAGHRVGIVCDSNTGGAHEEALFQAIEPALALGVTRTPMQRQVGPGDLRAAAGTLRALRGLKPDVLHGHGAKGGAYARLFGTLMGRGKGGVARLYTAHGGSLHFDENALKGRAFFAAERLMERFTDHLLFVSDYERQAFRRKVGAPRVPSSLVYNGLREDEFEPVEPAEGAADFLYIGAMRDLKGPDLFLDGLAAAEKARGRPLTAAMVGAGDDLPRYREQAARLGLGERVRFLDPMPARKAFALARCVVVPSRAEAMPYIVLEALAAVRPMIASAVGGIPEIFSAHPHALVSPEAQAIAARMADALADPDGFAAAMPPRENLMARFSANAMAAGIEAAYRAALSRRR